MYLFLQTKALIIEGWHLVFTGIGIVVPVLLSLIGFEKSRRKDLQKHLKGKADITYVDKQDDLIRDEIRSEINSHDRVHIEIGKQYKQIQSDLTLIKDHLINKK